MNLLEYRFALLKFDYQINFHEFVFLGQFIIKIDLKDKFQRFQINFQSQN